MKRSVMQMALCKLLEEQSVQGTSYMFRAQQILEFLQMNGMLPPQVKTERISKAVHPVTKETGEFRSWTMQSRWEDE